MCMVACAISPTNIQSLATVLSTLTSSARDQAGVYYHKQVDWETSRIKRKTQAIEIHTSTFNTECGVFRYDIKKNECITFQSLDCDEPSYDQYEQTMDTIGCSPDSPQPANVLEGLEWGKTVAHAICDMLKSPMLDVRADDIPYLADLVIEWNALVVIDHGDYFMNSEYPDGTHRRDDSRIRVARMYLSVALGVDGRGVGTAQAILCRQDDLVSTISSSKHAPVPTLRDTKTWTFLWETEKIFRYELDGYRIFHEYGTKIGREQDPTPQHVKKSLKVWDVPFSVRRKVARFLFFELCAMHPLEEPSFSRTQ
ncbi:hypothetical protein EV424DRAFT_1350816 [Suillus variegatus]|nr:hypothetical protein EV424DRAFT_1350816 [Suillus variegatus]